jgi:GNAT superfamily N-acetyltransferase
MDSNNDIWPDDVNDPNFLRYYGTGGEYATADAETLAVMKKVAGNPDAMVTVYRATPNADKSINKGDWVSPSKDYATQHGERYLEGGFSIAEMQVKASELHTDGDIHEWGYNPSKADDGVLGQTGKKDDLSTQAQKYNSSEEWLRAGGPDIDSLDEMAFGFSEKSLKTLSPKDLNIKWKEDMVNVEHVIKKSGKSETEWAKGVNLEEPIDVVFENGKFYVDDGHHRYTAAKILNKDLNINLEIKDKPIAKITGTKDYNYDDFVRGLWDETNTKTDDGVLGQIGKTKNPTTDLRNSLREGGYKIDMDEGISGEIKLSRIEVPPNVRGKGLGTAAMNQIIKMADESGKTITLTPDTSFGATSVSRLKKFYKKFGFVENKGKNKDFLYKDSMLRLPNSPKVGKADDGVLGQTPTKSLYHTADELGKEALEYDDINEFVTKVFKRQSTQKHAIRSSIAKDLGGEYSGNVEVPEGIANSIGDRGSRISVDGNDVYFHISVEKDIGGNDVIFLPNIAVSGKNKGLGTKFMNAMKNFSDKTSQDIVIYKVTNDDFFRKFDWLEETELGGSFKYKAKKGNESLGLGELDDIWKKAHTKTNSRQSKPLERQQSGMIDQMSNDDIALVGGMRSGNSKGDETRRMYIIYDMANMDEDFTNAKDQEIGSIQVFTEDATNKIRGIVDIKIPVNKRKQGHARKVIESLVKSEFSNKPFKIYDIKKSAYPFWKKMGVTFVNHDFGKDIGDTVGKIKGRWGTVNAYIGSEADIKKAMGDKHQDYLNSLTQ